MPASAANHLIRKGSAKKREKKKTQMDAKWEWQIQQKCLSTTPASQNVVRQGEESRGEQRRWNNSNNGGREGWERTAKIGKKNIYEKNNITGSRRRMRCFCSDKCPLPYPLPHTCRYHKLLNMQNKMTKEEELCQRQTSLDWGQRWHLSKDHQTTSTSN